MDTLGCITCSQPSTRVSCASCTDAGYCSLVCRQADEQFHQVICRSDPGARPSAQSRCIVYFPSSGHRPMFIWAPIGDLPRNKYRPILQRILGLNRGDVTLFSHTAYANVNTPTQIAVFHDGSIHNYHTENQAVAAATKGVCCMSWKGPILAYHSVSSAESPDIDQVLDMSMHNFSDLMKCLIDHGNDTAAHSALLGPAVQGIMIDTNCEDHHPPSLSFARPRMYPVEVPRFHPIFKLGKASLVSKKIGMPLLLYDEPCEHHPGERWCRAELPRDTNENPKSSKLHHDGLTNIRATDWAFVKHTCPELQTDNSPHVLLVRSDHKPLFGPELLGFSDFCVFHLLCYLDWYSTSDASNKASRQQEVLRQMTPQMWDAFYLAWCAASLSLGESHWPHGLDKHKCITWVLDNEDEVRRVLSGDGEAGDGEVDDGKISV